MHKLNWIFNPFPLPDDSSNIQPKEKKGPLHIFSFRCSFLCYISYDVSLSVLLSRNIQIPIIQVADEKHFFSEAGKLIQSTKIVLYT